jgi:transglutaminase-like putative cysteine protease
MKFGLVHRTMTNALATLGVLAVVTSSMMTPWTAGFILASLALALVVPDEWQTHVGMRRMASIAPILLFLYEIARLASGRSAIDVAVEFAALLQIIRVATRRGAAHDQQIILLALLHFVAGTVLGGGLTFGLCFLGFLVVAPGALVLSHLRREVEGNYRQGARDRTGLPVDVPRILRSRRVIGRGFLLATCLMSLPIFLFTAALFVMFPRVGLSLLLVNQRPGERMVGFSDRVDLGEVGALRDVPALALRFNVDDLPEPRPQKLTLRLRGTAFDSYDGRRWERTQSNSSYGSLRSQKTLPLSRTPSSKDRKVTFELEPIDPTVVFLPPRTVALELQTGDRNLAAPPIELATGPEGEVRYSSEAAHGLRYTAFLATDREVIVERLPREERERYLRLPGDTSARIVKLAHEWADPQPTNALKAKAIEEHLKRDFTYRLGSPSGGKPQPIDHFLFESKEGHCEFFSTAMAVMLRAVGIPSRNVTGFVGGTYNRFGQYYAVRQGDAHSWVEAYLDEPYPGWTTFDPTPSAGAQPLQQTAGAWIYIRDFIEALSQRWSHYVVGYDLAQQVTLFQAASRTYEAARLKVGANRGALGVLTKPRTLATLVVGTSVIAYALWRLRRRQRGREKDTREKRGAERRSAITATALYRQLEQALSTQGIGRPPSLPPLRHAEELLSQEHPLAASVVDLTTRYIRARFGGDDLDAQSRRDFERQIRAIRKYQPNTRSPKRT